MEKIKTKNKNRFNQIVLISSLLAILIVTISILSITGAWFTKNKSNSQNLQTALISVSAQEGVTNIANNTLTISQTETTGSNLIDSTNGISFVSTSNIDVCVRVRVIFNWSTNDALFEDAESCFDITWNNNFITSSTTGFKYYTGTITYNTPTNIISSISLKSAKTMPSDLVVNVFVEAVQKDNVGKALFQQNDTGLTSSNWTTIFGV